VCGCVLTDRAPREYLRTGLHSVLHSGCGDAPILFTDTMLTNGCACIFAKSTSKCLGERRAKNDPP
jgi:hypothetical protein